MESSQVQQQILAAESAFRRTIQQGLIAFNKKIQESLVVSTVSKSIRQVNQRQKSGPEKIHVYKQSLLSSLMQINDYKTIYNIVASSFVPLRKYGELLDLQTFGECFGNADKMFICWWVLAFVNYTIVPLVYYSISMKLSVWVWVPIYVIHQLVLLCLPSMFVDKYNPGFGACMVIMVEGARMMMKSHSYLRNKMLYCTNNRFRNEEFWPDSPQKKSQKHKQQQRTKSQVKLPVFNLHDISTQIRRYSYFFIAPTLIYRDNYVLSPSRSFTTALTHFLNFLICIYYAFMVYILCCKNVIEELGKNLTFANFIVSVLKLMLPSMLFLILGFFGFLHSWLNGWAELTRFPDRVFYLDWWNSMEFGTYYRKWNIVVHDWLYYYVYMDLQRFFLRSKFYAKLLTFLFSALIHQLILIKASGLFYPVLFVMFTGPGILLIQNQQKLRLISNNFFFWVEMYLGTSLLFVLYLMESSARSIVSDEFMRQRWGVMQFLIPRTLYLQ